MTDTAAITTIDNRPPIVVLRDRLEMRKSEIKAALPSDISVDAFIRAVITSATLNPDILGCTWQSVWLACMTACRDGLLPDGVEGAIVPYKSKASWLPMYQGLLRRFRRSGQFKWVKADLVRQGESFDHYIDEQGEHFYHKPGDSSEAPIVKIYALATTKDGGFFATVMTIADANKRRAMSRASRDDAPWKLWPEEMYKKTALRNLSKLLPSARDLIPPEDTPEIEAPTIVPAITAGEPPRASGPAAALAQFAGSDEPFAADTPSAGQSVSEPAAATPPAQAAAGTSSAPERKPDETPPMPAEPAATAHNPPAAGSQADSIETAHKRGVEARAKGVGRRAVPGEYRDPSATALAAAWVKGWDGASL